MQNDYPPDAPPPGWYRDTTGRLMWWDGYTWNPHASTDAPAPWALLAHLSLFAIAVIGPIAILVTAGRTDRFVSHHAREALNAQIWFAIVWNLLAGSAIVSAVAAGDADPPAWFVIALGLAAALLALTAGFAVRGAVQAARGIWWRYPLPFRFVRESGDA